MIQYIFFLFHTSEWMINMLQVLQYAKEEIWDNKRI